MDSERLDELVNWWDKNYECIFDQDVLEKVKLGTKNTSCRFCRRSYPEVKFRSTAHALPEFLNNDKLVNLNECDGCNNLFGRTIEDNLASYLAPFRIASTISGRKSTFTYKLDELNRIDIKEGHIEIKESTQGNLLKIIDEHNVELKVRRPKYIPIMAYKALVKMAVSIIPDSEIENLAATIDWLRSQKKSIEDYFGRFVQFRFFPGFNPFPFIKAMIFRRKSAELFSPMYYFVLTFKNYYFQVVVPCFLKDKYLDNQKVVLRGFPTPFDMIPYPYEKQGGLLSLAGREPVVNEIFPMIMHYESKEVSMHLEG